VAVLDGSRSLDIENDPLQFLWSEGGKSIGTGKVAVVSLPVGSNSIVLRVSDGLAWATDTITIKVVAGRSSIQPIIDLLLRSRLPRRTVRSLLEALESVEEALEEGHLRQALHHLEKFQDKVRQKIGSSDSVLAAQLIQMAQSIIDAAGEPGPKPKLTIKSHAHEGECRIRISFNAVSARDYVVESSADMIHWEAVGVAQPAGEGEFQFDCDTSTATPPGRFYRVRVP
jgi:hypothetical protein